jgi:hypothetical protein
MFMVDHSLLAGRTVLAASPGRGEKGLPARNAEGSSGMSEAAKHEQGNDGGGSRYTVEKLCDKPAKMLLGMLFN